MNDKNAIEEERKRRYALASNLFDRVRCLKGRFYTGCGFHYSLEATASRSLANYGPEAFYREHDHAVRLVWEVIQDDLLRSVQRAELSAIRNERKRNRATVA